MASHRRLEALFAVAKQGLEQLPLSTGAFDIFREAIERHMIAEEEVLFPRYESNRTEHALTDILRKGHADLRAFFEELVDALVGQDVDEAAALMGILGQILKHHDEKEESELYPALEGLFAAVEVQQLAHRIA